MNDRNPRVVIVGGGFGGVAAAKALKNSPARVVLVDRTNHHLFQPLLYQVAISVLTPGQIASPIRAIVRKQRNTTVILGEVTGPASFRTSRGRGRSQSASGSADVCPGGRGTDGGGNGRSDCHFGTKHGSFGISQD